MIDRRAAATARHDPEDEPVAATEEILGQFLGDETFPVAWESDVEKDFFWVYDDLHIPHPVSPMFFDIGGWWLSLRPHVPPVRDAVRGRLAGQERQRLRLHDGHPGRSGPAHRGHRIQRPLRRPRPARRDLRDDDGRLPRHRPAGLRRALRRLVARPAACPRCSATSTTSRSVSTPPTACRWPRRRPSSRTPSTSTIATGRSTGCSTSPSCRRR